MAIASAVTVSAACIGDDILLHGISADGGVGNIRDKSLALGPENTSINTAVRIGWLSTFTSLRTTTNLVLSPLFRENLTGTVNKIKSFGWQQKT